MDGQSVMRWKQVKKVDLCSQAASYLIRIIHPGLSSAVQQRRIASP
jgi:hypothetical protein